MADLTEGDLAKIRAWVDAAPPLTDAQVARVARLLTPYATTERTTAMPTIRDTATVRPSEPVDGDARRRSPSRASSSNTRRVTTTRHEVAPKALMDAARRAQRPGQRIVVVSATEVRLVNG